MSDAIKELKLLRKQYMKNAVACERIVYNNRPDDNNWASDESFKQSIAATAQRWLWLQVAGDIEKVLSALE